MYLFESDNLDHLGDYIILALEKRRDKELLDDLLTNAVLKSSEMS